MIVAAFVIVLWLAWQVVRCADAFESLGWHRRTADSRLAMYCGRNPFDVRLPSECARPELQLSGAIR
jgi:hypothetical protein